MRTVCLYGRTVNWGSHAQVTEGFRIALSHHDRLAALVPVDLAAEDESPGRSAAVGLLTGPLTTLGQVSPTHQVRTAMVAPNSSRIPPALAQSLETQTQVILAPSEWAAGVLRSEVPGKRVISVPHGVNPGLVMEPGRRWHCLRSFHAGQFNLLHFSTTDRERKGTQELVRAWSLVKGDLPKEARLILILDPNARHRLVDDAAELGIPIGTDAGVLVAPRIEQEFDPGRVGAPPEVFGRSVLSVCHAVIQPSRGEGFGLIPLEARALGVPVIATTEATGHQEHLRGTGFRDGVVPVPVGPDAPIDDVPGAMAPSVSPDAIAAAILQAYANYEVLLENSMEMAAAVRERWAWCRVIRPFLEFLDESG